MPDNLTPAARSYCMSRVRSRNTAPELALRTQLRRFRLRFRTHVRDLPGTPDLVFDAPRLVVFVDGDFWHGYRFPLWKKSLKLFWQTKIARNRRRDQLTFRRLRRHGWTVLRLWQHQIDSDASGCAARVSALVSGTAPKAVGVRRKHGRAA
jgi:DNA mismatch endonuclease (patch repair protein)